MKHIRTVGLLIMLCSVFGSCKKGSNLTEREKQEQEEQTAILLQNEIIEQEGIRFVLNYDQE
ncbi:MAG: hypothetical protein EOO04_30720, partial [Chitinophagaceae bacterium]